MKFKLSFGEILVGAIAVIGIFAVLFGHPSKRQKPKEYPSCGIVVEVSQEEDYYIIEDPSGNRWLLDGAEDWTKGDICAMLINDCGTRKLYDDEILSVRYCGRK